jgi:hypothetical protein
MWSTRSVLKRDALLFMLVHLVAHLQEELRQVRAISPGNAGDEPCLAHQFPPR